MKTRIIWSIKETQRLLTFHAITEFLMFSMLFSQLAMKFNLKIIEIIFCWVVIFMRWKRARAWERWKCFLMFAVAFFQIQRFLGKVFVYIFHSTAWWCWSSDDQIKYWRDYRIRRAIFFGFSISLRLSDELGMCACWKNFSHLRHFRTRIWN